MANRFNHFFKEKNDKIREKFTDSNEEAIEHDMKFDGQQMDNFSTISLNTMRQIKHASKPEPDYRDPIPSVYGKISAHYLPNRQPIS